MGVTNLFCLECKTWEHILLWQEQSCETRYTLIISGLFAWWWSPYNAIQTSLHHTQLEPTTSFSSDNGLLCRLYDVVMPWGWRVFQTHLIGESFVEAKFHAKPFYIFINFNYNIFVLVGKNVDILRHYIGWDTKKSLEQTVDLGFSPVWVDTNAMLIAWKLQVEEYGLISIPTKHMKFAKNTFPCINVSQIANESDRPNEWLFI